MRMAVIALSALLTACAASVGGPRSLLGADLLFDPPQEAFRHFSASGTTFFGKFATSSALNSRRDFAADYHGDMHLSFFPNGKIECRWFAEGVLPTETGHEEAIAADSALCVGKLQRDGSFEFQGMYVMKSRNLSGELLEEQLRDEGTTFTLRGIVKGDTVDGDLLPGSVFGNTSSGEMLGVRFEAVAQEQD